MTIPDVLRRILSHKREELEDRKSSVPLPKVAAVARHAPPPRDFAGALAGNEVSIIAEIKRSSPSEGAICETEFDPAAIAREYESGGAAAISILTDERFFGGHLDHLSAARETTKLPLLRKDFVVDEYQVHEARAAGADAVLLIVAALEPPMLCELRALAEELGLAALVETHDERELEVALECDAKLIGVNNRNLRSFEVDLGTTERLAATVPPDRLLVAESGVRTREDIERLARAGADAALIGTTLMRAGQAGEALRGLTGVGREKRS